MARRLGLQGVEPFDCTVQPGDALFIPSHVFHIVYAPGESIAVTYFWRGRFPPPGVPMRLVARDVLGLGNRLAQFLAVKAAARVGALEPLLERARRTAWLDDRDVEMVRKLLLEDSRDPRADEAATR